MISKEDRALIIALTEERTRIKQKRNENLIENVKLSKELKQLTNIELAKKFECEVHTIKKISEGYMS